MAWSRVCASLSRQRWRRWLCERRRRRRTSAVRRVADALAHYPCAVLLNRGVGPLVPEGRGVGTRLALPQRQRLRVCPALKKQELAHRTAQRRRRVHLLAHQQKEMPDKHHALDAGDVLQPRLTRNASDKASGKHLHVQNVAAVSDVKSGLGEHRRHKQAHLAPSVASAVVIVGLGEHRRDGNAYEVAPHRLLAATAASISCWGGIHHGAVLEGTIGSRPRTTTIRINHRLGPTSGRGLRGSSGRHRAGEGHRQRP